MQNLKFGVLVCGLLGIVGAFIPTEGHSFFSGRIVPGQAAQVYMVLGGYAAGLIMGAMGAAKGMQRWMSIVALLGFAFVMFKFRSFLPFDMFKSGSGIGGKLMAIGMFGGVIFSILTLAKPEPAR